jgi:hypothetical protein
MARDPSIECPNWRLLPCFSGFPPKETALRSLIQALRKIAERIRGICLSHSIRSSMSPTSSVPQRTAHRW